MAASQEGCLIDKPWRSAGAPTPGGCTENQRLAIEELLARGTSGYQTQCAKNKLHPFLSHREVERCLREDGRAKSASGASDLGSSAMVDSSSLTYWPEQSEKEPPNLDLGWPLPSSFRGVTNATVHTQPPLEENETCIKNTVRKLIQNAQKVIAIVMDTFTDPDIFGDVVEAARKRWVPVYIIHDNENFPEFLAMCKHCKVDFDVVRKMRVRTLAGLTFSARTGKKLVGSLGERFMIVDGDKAITGSYSFTWTASRIDRHIMTLLSGQIVEKFDFEFRTLYAQSKPASTTTALPMLNHSLTNKGENNGPKASYGHRENGTRPKAANLAVRVTNPLYALVKQGMRKETLERKDSAPLSDAGANKTVERQITTPPAKTQSIEGRNPLSPQLVETDGRSNRQGAKPFGVPKVPDDVMKHKRETCFNFEDGKEVPCESKLAMSAITDTTATKRRANTLGKDFLENTKTMSKSTFQLNDESLQDGMNSAEPSVSENSENKPHEKDRLSIPPIYFPGQPLELLCLSICHNLSWADHISKLGS
uniref:protein FAM83E-like isoform X2 n=1 Tax=Myxine glutinosa TaxID=7769 RepID=UPI00358EA431